MYCTMRDEKADSGYGSRETLIKMTETDRKI